MGTFRKFFFILYSRRPRSRLLVKQKKIGIIDQKILSYSPTVKEKIAFENGLRFQIQIEALHLKSCILRENSKNKSSGSTPCFPRKFPAMSNTYLFHQLLWGRGMLWGLKITGRSHASRINICFEYRKLFGFPGSEGRKQLHSI
jgi:hypothetical protein